MNAYFMLNLLNQTKFCYILTTFAKRIIKMEHNMTQEYARVSVEMPENEEKESLHQELTYEIENPDINDEFTIKF